VYAWANMGHPSREQGFVSSACDNCACKSGLAGDSVIAARNCTTTSLMRPDNAYVIADSDVGLYATTSVSFYLTKTRVVFDCSVEDTTSRQAQPAG
jgi:hypothetical protein